VVPAVAGSAGCRTATQIVVEVESDQCARIQSTDVTVASDETALATKTISDASRAGCVSPPQIGRVVLVPDGADDKEVVIRIVSGLDKPASTCREGDEGCIVARRRARFVPNEIVRVSVVMSLTCQRVVCTAGESCDPMTGKCVDISSVSAPPSVDAGPDDAAVAADASGTSCNANGCVFECNSPRQCRTMPCQPGLPCIINCNRENACSDVDCGAASTCEINCNVEDACTGALGTRCRDAGRCTVNCRDRRACGSTILCSCNGQCDVKCSAERCDQQNVLCCRDDGCEMPESFRCLGQCD
jgi:hypothetical protein